MCHDLDGLKDRLERLGRRCRQKARRIHPGAIDRDGAHRSADGGQFWAHRQFSRRAPIETAGLGEWRPPFLFSQEVNDMTHVTLNTPEIAAILAGLRMLQQGLIAGGIPDYAHRILIASDDPGLSPEDIDELCERINTEEDDDGLWVAIRLDNNGAYTGTEKQMRAKIASELAPRPTLGWGLGRLTSRFVSEVLPPTETKI